MKNQAEKWAFIADYSNYQVSNFGNVRRIWSSGPKLLTPVAMQDGRLSVMLYKDGMRRWHKIHRLVAMSFIPLDPSRDLVAHNDGNPSNNHWENLRWATQKENLSDRIRHGTGIDGQKNGRVKLTIDQVREIRARYKKRHPQDGAAAMAKEFGVSDVAIIKAFRGENWSTLS